MTPEQKVVVITGASRGIGAHFIRQNDIGPKPFPLFNSRLTEQENLK
jgi:hypothetical protein